MDIINHKMDIVTEKDLDQTIHQLLRLANESSNYKSKVYNDKLEKYINKNEKYYDEWSVEECINIVMKCTQIGMHKFEKLDKHIMKNLMAREEEYIQKPYLLHSYICTI